MARVVILGSGRGSNAEAILKAQQSGKLGSGKVVAIFSDIEDARILQLGPQFGVPAHHLPVGGFRTKLSPEAEQQWIRAITDYTPDLIVLAGFMRVLKSPFLKAFSGKIINLHPSLLPEFPGLNAIQQALDAHVPKTGCTVHWVNEIVDGGEIIAQSVVDISRGDDFESLAAKVHAAEHKILPEVIKHLSLQGIH